MSLIGSTESISPQVNTNTRMQKYIHIAQTVSSRLPTADLIPHQANANGKTIPVLN
jgi:hypothetical protein